MCRYILRIPWWPCLSYRICCWWWFIQKLSNSNLLSFNASSASHKRPSPMPSWGCQFYWGIPRLQVPRSQEWLMIFGYRVFKGQSHGGLVLSTHSPCGVGIHGEFERLFGLGLKYSCKEDTTSSANISMTPGYQGPSCIYEPDLSRKLFHVMFPPDKDDESHLTNIDKLG